MKTYPFSILYHLYLSNHHLNEYFLKIHRVNKMKDKKPKEYKLAEKYFQHLGKRTKIKNENDRKKYKFII